MTAVSVEKSVEHAARSSGLISTREYRDEPLLIGAQARASFQSIVKSIAPPCQVLTDVMLTR